MRSVCVIGTLACLIGLAACASSAGTTEFGHPVHTAPFTVIGAPHSLRWIDDSRIGYSGEHGLVIWDIERGTTTEIADRRLLCVAPGEDEPVLLTQGLTTVPPRGDPPEGDPRTTLVYPVFLGPLGREERLGPDQERTILAPARDRRTASGEVVKEWFVRDRFTGCRGRWLPDGDTPAHMATAGGHLFGGALGFERGRKETEHMRLLRAAQPEAQDLPVTRCDVGGLWSDLSYFEFKNAYLALGERDVDPTTGACRQVSPGRPMRYWWLHQDGHVEGGIVPALYDAYELAKRIRPGQAFMHNLSGINYHYPTRAGFIFSILYSRRSGQAHHALFLQHGDSWHLLYEAPIIDNALKPSPGGCRIAFGEGKAGDWLGFNPTPHALRVIDLCDATLELDRQPAPVGDGAIHHGPRLHVKGAT